MPPEIMPPVDPPEPDPAPDPSPRRRAPIVCEYCDCTLTPIGDVLKVSDKARTLRKQGDRIDTLLAEIEQAKTDLAAAKAEIQILRRPTETPARAGVLGIGRGAGE
jgi:hypothetical protein